MARSLRDRIESIAKSIFVGACVVGGASILTMGIIDANAPHAPDPATNRVYPEQVKSWVGYFSPLELEVKRYVFFSLLGAAASSAASFAVGIATQRRR